MQGLHLLASDGVHQLDVLEADGPVDAVVGSLARLPHLLAGHQVELGRVEPEPVRERVQGVLDSAGESSVHVGGVEQ